MSIEKHKKSHQQIVLDALADHGPLTRRELSLVTGIPSPNLSSPLERLIHWKLIIIHSHTKPAGRRARRYALSNGYIYVPYTDIVKLSETTLFKDKNGSDYIDGIYKDLAMEWLKQMK